MWRKQRVADAAESAVAYMDPLVKDEKLRARLVRALRAAGAARGSVQRQVGVTATAQRLASDPILRAQLGETMRQLQAARKRARKARSHRRRNVTLFLAALGLGTAAAPFLRRRLLKRETGPSEWPSSDGTASDLAEVDEEIVVGVPVTTAYNQWTQFEEFPRFMDGVEEVRQLDETLLHWVATIGGRRAEWEAKIVEQQPDRRITWESTDGRETRGTVSFEEAGPGRTRIRLHMSYRLEGGVERVGSAIGVDARRIRSDLERFRDLIEGRGVETGGWRGEIKQGSASVPPRTG